MLAPVPVGNARLSEELWRFERTVLKRACNLMFEELVHGFFSALVTSQHAYVQNSFITMFMLLREKGMPALLLLRAACATCASGTQLRCGLRGRRQHRRRQVDVTVILAIERGRTRRARTLASLALIVALAHPSKARARVRGTRPQLLRGIRAKRQALGDAGGHGAQGHAARVRADLRGDGPAAQQLQLERMLCLVGNGQLA